MIPFVKLGALSVVAVGFFLAGHFYGSIPAHPKSAAVEKALARRQQLMFKDLARNSVFDQFLKTNDLDALEKAANLAQSWPAANTLTKDLLAERQKNVQELKRLALQVLGQAKSSLEGKRYSKARTVLDLLGKSTAIAHDRLEDVLFAAGGRWDLDTTKADAPDNAMSISGELIVEVKQGPFGMHVKRGSTTVSEVFPGSAAQRAGVKPGCQIVSIAGHAVTAGSWLQMFQRQRKSNKKQAFKIQLDCSARPTELAVTTQGPKGTKPPKDPHKVNVMVLKKPFGMNIQVWQTPRVVEVLPGFPAEKQGVRAGWVLIHVNSKPVNLNTWSDMFEKCKVPCLLTFDTDVQVHVGNPFFIKDANGSFIFDHEYFNKRNFEMMNETHLHAEEHFQDFRCEVSAFPFGAQIRAPLGGRPVVQSVSAGLPAEKVGVLEGDILIEVAGRKVNASTWFLAFQQASPPFGLRFKRPLEHVHVEHAELDLPGGFPAMPHV